ncbi:PAS domain-containing protein [Demequina sp.]|uniref:hybrid sensor histidine kinase/response regulator n=1 Tax=Demequina sp. TaxID=2050685 RepID=UPI0025BB3667|nr:PAS domain-containing protein [Demequina sp.]
MVVLATLANFAVDLALPPSYNVATLYAVTVIAVAGLGHDTRAVLWAAAGTIALTWTGLLATWPEAGDHHQTEMVIERGVATALIALSALVMILMLARDRENLRLGSQLRQAEADRDADQRMLAAASEVAPIGTWSIDRGDDRVTWSDTAAVMHGRDPGYQPSSQELMAYLTPHDVERFSNALNGAWTDGAPFREELRITLPNGEQRWVVAMGETLRGDDDVVRRVHGTVQDITPWKHAELAAVMQGERFAQLTRTLPIIVWTANADGLIDYFNDALMEYTGATAEQLLEDQWVGTVHPRDLEMVTTKWSAAVATGNPYDVEFRVRAADGTYRWHHVAAQPEKDDDGSVARWWGSSINIDAARRLREHADELAAERKVILDSMSDGVCALNSAWQIIYVNASAERILGRRRGELVGSTIWDVYPTSTDDPVHRAFTAAMDEGKAERLTFHSELLHKWLELSVTRNTMGVTAFLRDITEVRQLSDRLAQAQRLEAVGQLTGGIAHDFNNLLTVVLGGADALRADEQVTGEAREMAEMIAKAAERGAELTHRLLAFARRQPLEPRSVDLAQQIAALAPLLRRTLGEDISMEIIPQLGDCFAEADPGQFESALLNLAINSRDAMPHGGTLTIEIELVTLDEAYSTRYAEVAPGTYVVTTVTDSGTGIPPEHLDRLFEPFFTTKTGGKGSGLGLPMVWGFVKQSHGHLTVYSEPSYGTSIKLYLPASHVAPTPLESRVTAPDTRRVSGVILVAEDDDLVRKFATDRLRARGYDVVEAVSGPEALTVMESTERVDLLFTDVIMPGGMTGRELADAVLERRPGLPVLFASGYTENVIIHNGRLDPGVNLLAKPYSASQLCERVGELLAPREEEAE